MSSYTTPNHKELKELLDKNGPLKNDALGLDPCALETYFLKAGHFISQHMLKMKVIGPDLLQGPGIFFTHHSVSSWQAFLALESLGLFFSHPPRVMRIMANPKIFSAPFLSIGLQKIGIFPFHKNNLEYLCKRNFSLGFLLSSKQLSSLKSSAIKKSLLSQKEEIEALLHFAKLYNYPIYPLKILLNETKSLSIQVLKPEINPSLTKVLHLLS